MITSLSLQRKEPKVAEPVTKEMEQAWKELEQRFQWECGVSLAEADKVFPPVVEEVLV